MLSEEYLLILCDILIHHNVEIVKAWALCPVALKTSFSLMRKYWICFFLIELESKFSQDSKTQYTSYLAMGAGIAQFLIYPWLRYPGHREKWDYFTFHVHHTSAAGARFLHWLDVINMLKGRTVKKEKKKGCTPGGRGSKDKKKEKWASGN